ncbi:MAG TPA: protein disulfide oxidoreductase [Gammaproteobacteria bacterium]
MKLKGTWSKRLLRWAGELLLLAAVLLAIEAWMTRDVPRGVTVTLAAQRLDGQPFDISQWRGSSGIIYFWAEWCPVCKANRHVITSLAEGQRVMTIAMQSGTAAEVAAYMQKEQFALPVIVDEQGEIARRFRVSGVPVALIIDRDGRISYVARGYTTELGLRLRLWLAS